MAGITVIYVSYVHYVTCFVVLEFVCDEKYFQERYRARRVYSHMGTQMTYRTKLIISFFDKCVTYNVSPIGKVLLLLIWTGVT